MGLFRKRPPVADATAPTERGSCSCPEHVQRLLGVVVPVAAAWEADTEAMTVGELIEVEALGIDPAELVWIDDQESGTRRGPFHWRLWIGDEARTAYDDDAPLAVDAALLEQPGIEVVDWEDREVFHLAAPTLCADGALAAAVRALLDPRVKG
ncbi:hypothetical protein [Nocardioides sp. P5_C9_2]